MPDTLLSWIDYGWGVTARAGNAPLRSREYIISARSLHVKSTTYQTARFIRAQY